MSLKFTTIKIINTYLGKDGITALYNNYFSTLPTYTPPPITKTTITTIPPDTLNIILSYVEPKHLIKFFATNQLNFNTKFRYDASNNIDILELFPNVHIHSMFIENISKINPNQKFNRLQRLTLVGQKYWKSPTFSDRRPICTLHILNSCPNLTFLSISDAHLTEPHPISLPNVRHMKISRSKNTSIVLNSLTCPQLQNLELSNCNSDDICIISKFIALTSLTLTYIDLNEILKFPNNNLRNLTIKYMNGLNVMGIDISSCTTLQKLKINSRYMTIINGLHKCRNLRAIDLIFCPNININILKNMPCLKYIALNTRITQNLSFLNTCSKLSTITIPKLATIDASVLNKSIKIHRK